MTHVLLALVAAAAAVCAWRAALVYQRLAGRGPAWALAGALPLVAVFFVLAVAVMAAAQLLS